ncbi:MAG: glycoside hydrolase family 2 TIM barrel-domain containing protein [Candidatus Omnitrophota bacterium]|jgi:beta-glucuronidase
MISNDRCIKNVGHAVPAALIVVCVFFLSGCADKIVFEENPAFKLADKGSEEIINYERYGRFEGIGTSDYRYSVIDQAGLSKAAGEGIHPNSSAALKDPLYKELKKSGALDGTHWDFINKPQYAENFYKWATTAEERGVKLFYTALALEKAGCIKHAIKAYYAVVIHFPKTIGWTYWKTPWYVGQAAIDRINFLCRQYPQLGWRLEGAYVIVDNSYDDNPKTDVFLVDPGKIVKVKPSRAYNYGRKKDLSRQNIIKSTNGDRVKLVQYEDKSWQLLVNGRPYIIKGIAYEPSKIGQSPDQGTLEDWMQHDYNENDKIDGPYDAWVDQNRNNARDDDENPVGDFRLLWEMGCNTIRVYNHASNKPLLKDLYENFGIMSLMGDFLGAYAIGSGASWYKGTDYSDPVQQQNMLDNLKKMIEEHKQEGYVLMWVLGNENNYGVANSAKRDPVSYYRFVNKAAELIKSLDPYHRPVAISNGEVKFIDIFAKECPAVDVFGLNAYRGDHGFGHLWLTAKRETDKPVLITEYGCPAYNRYADAQTAEEQQAQYLKNCWIDVVSNSNGWGQGNAIGAVLFEWVDEWWKAYEPGMHDTKPLWAGNFPDGWMYEEWLGVTSQGQGKDSPFQRILRKSYYEYKKLWRD